MVVGTSGGKFLFLYTPVKAHGLAERHGLRDAHGMGGGHARY